MSMISFLRYTETAYPGGNAGRGIVVFDLNTGSETITYPYPSGETDIDGIAFDPSGTIWYLEDEPAPLHNH